MLNQGFLRSGCILAILLSACVPALRAPTSPQAVPSPAADWTIKLTQSGGFAGVMLTVQVSSDGRLTAQNQRAMRSVTQILPPETVAQLARYHARALQVTPAAPHTGCADCFLYSLEFSSSGTTSHIEADDTTLADSGVAELVRLLQQVRDRALGSNP